MKKKFLKIFFIYSYISLLFYVGSESALIVAKWMAKSGEGKKGRLKIQSSWKTSIKRIKETWKIILRET